MSTKNRASVLHHGEEAKILRDPNRKVTLNKIDDPTYNRLCEQAEKDIAEIEDLNNEIESARTAYWGVCHVNIVKDWQMEDALDIMLYCYSASA